MTTQQQILNELSETGPGSAWDLALMLRLPTKTVGMALSRLLDKGRVRVVGVQKPETGRPARIFEVT